MERKQGNTKGRKEGEKKKKHNKSVMSAELTYNFTEIGQTENKNRNRKINKKRKITRKENLYILVWIDKIRKWQKNAKLKDGIYQQFFLY